MQRQTSPQRATLLMPGILVLLMAFNPLAAAQVERSDSTTGARSWETRHQGVTFSLTQILPEQGDAFYVNRGFTLDQIKPFTSACVFMTVLRNDSAAGSVHFVRKHWSVSVDEQPHSFKTVKQWIELLKQRQASKPALIAFQWAQFPPEQEYQPGGDWNQGMLALELAPDQEFSITARWDIEGRNQATTITGVQCAK